MDGSVSVSHSERTRIQPSQGFGNRAANEAHTHSALFEQLLNMSFTVQQPPEKLNEPAEPPSTEPQDATCECEDEKGDRPVDEEADEKVSLDSPASLIPPAAIEKQKALEQESGKATSGEPSNLTPEVKLCDLPKVADEAIQPASLEAPVRGDERVEITVNDAVPSAEPTSRQEVRTNAIAAANSDEGEVIRRQSKENASADFKAATSTSAEPIAEPTVKTKEEPQPEKTQAIQSEIADQNSVSETKNQTDDDRRSDRRNKWFEQDASIVRTSDSELAQGATQSTRQPQETPLATAVSDAHLASALPTEAPQAPSELPSAPPTAGTPIAVPISLMAGAQPPVASSSHSASPTSETQRLGPTEPTRNVGTQAAKGEAKGKTEGSEITQQERVRVIQRIARSFNRISAEGGTINLRLHPEHLGSVTVQVRLEGRSMAARLTTETTAARDAIMADLPALRQRLADQGFDVTKFQVDVSGNGADATFAQTNGESQSRQYEDRSSRSQTDYRRVAANREARLAFAGPAAVTATSASLAGAGIDLQV